MHKRRIIYIIIAIVVLMLAIVFWFSFFADVPLLGHLKFEEAVYGLEIKPYHDETDDIYYLFIPSYVNPDDIKIGTSDFVNFSFSDKTENYGADLSEVPLSQDIALTLTNFFRKETYSFQIWQCEMLPTVYVETESGSMDEVEANKNNEEDATVVVIDEDRTVEFSGLSTITGRGNSTWGQAKRPYNLKFDEETNFIDDIKAKTWCLLANYSDSTKIRNALCSNIAQEMGIAYTSDIEFVSLFINGEYYGLYNVATKQRYKQDSTVKAVFEKNNSDRPYDYMTENDSYISFEYGDNKSIENAVESFEKALYEEGTDYEEIKKYIDVSSFARKYLVDVYTMNEDTSYSQYFSIDTEGKITAICAWDYDLTFGSSWNQYIDHGYTYIPLGNSWCEQLLQYEEFKDEVRVLFNQYLDILEMLSIDFINQCYQLIANDWITDCIRWENSEPFREGRVILKNDTYDFTTLEGNKLYLIDLLKKRYHFLKSYWDDSKSFCRLKFSDDVIGTSTIYCERECPLTNDMIPGGLLTIPLEGFDGWYTEDGISITDVKTVTEDMTFQGIWDTMKDKSNGDNPLIAFMKKVYHGLGLDSFGITRLVICGLFSLALLGLLCMEIIRWILQRRGKR